MSIHCALASLGRRAGGVGGSRPLRIHCALASLGRGVGGVGSSSLHGWMLVRINESEMMYTLRLLKENQHKHSKEAVQESN